MFKTLKFLKWTFFFKCIFSLLSVHHSSSKEKMILTLVINITKGIEIGEIHFYSTFEYIWVKHVFGLENYEV